MIAVLLLVAGGFLFLLERLYEHFWHKNLLVTVDFLQPAAYAGGRAHLREVIENRKSLPIPVLEIGFRIEKGLSYPEAPNVVTSDFVYKRDIFSLLGMEQITRRYLLDCEERGRYHITQLTLSSRSLLGRHRFLGEAKSDALFYVYPARAKIASLLPSLEALIGEVQSSRRLYEDPFAFRGIRPYDPTDPQRSINWKATAKSGELMVNTYDSVTSAQADLFVDVSDPFIIKKPRLQEEVLSLAATLAARMIGEGLSVSFYANAPDLPEGVKPGKAEGENFFLPPGKGKHQLQTIERYLTAPFVSMPCQNYAGMLRSVQALGEKEKEKRKVSPRVRLFLSMNQDEEIQEAILSLLGKDGSGIWIVPIYADGKITLPKKGRLLILPQVL